MPGRAEYCRPVILDGPRPGSTRAKPVMIVTVSVTHIGIISHQQIKEPNVKAQEGLKEYNLIQLFCIVKMYL